MSKVSVVTLHLHPFWTLKLDYHHHVVVVVTPFVPGLPHQSTSWGSLSYGGQFMVHQSPGLPIFHLSKSKADVVQYLIYFVFEINSHIRIAKNGLLVCLNF